MSSIASMHVRAIASTQLLADTFLHRAFLQGVSVTPSKLQWLIYLVCVDWMKKTKQPLIAEWFVRGDCGPFLISVAHEFGKCYGNNPIRRFSKDAEENVYVLGADSPMFDSLERIWARYKDASEAELSRIVCQKGGAWEKSRLKKKVFLQIDDMFDDIVE